MHLSLLSPARPLTQTRRRARGARAHRSVAHRSVAHRGASAQRPENTLSAVRKALDHGVDMVEVDVQRTRDGALVVMHDATLERTTDVHELYPDRAPWHVGDFTLAELRRLDAGSWRGPEHAGEVVPLLEEVVDLVRRSPAGLLVELKKPRLYPGVVRDLVATLRSVPGYVDEATSSGRLVVQSFDTAAMKEHKTREPGIPVGLVGTPRRQNLPALATWADQVNPHHRAVDREYVDQVRELGMACHVWTVDRRRAMERALRLGVDGVITNRPGLLGEVLRDRTAALVGGSVGSRW